MKKNLYHGNIDCPLDGVNGTKLNIHHLGMRQFECYFSDTDILNLSIVYLTRISWIKYKLSQQVASSIS